jgi:hypothetical protein
MTKVAMMLEQSGPTGLAPSPQRVSRCFLPQLKPKTPAPATFQRDLSR